MFDTLAPDDLLTEVEQCRREESAAIARRMTAVARLLWHRTAEAEGVDDDDPSYALITGFARTCAEIGAALNASPQAASVIVAQAEALDTRLPEVAGLLADGRIDWPTTEAIIKRTELVDSDLMPQIDQRMSNKVSTWQSWSRRRVINATDAAIKAIDADAVKKRRLSADTERRVTVTAQPNGMASVRISMPAPAATMFDKRLTEMANTVCANDPRTLQQRRVDAIDALGARRDLGCACGRSDCTARPVPAEPSGAARFVINVIATDATVTGRSEESGYLEGYGVIDAEQVRQLADQALLRPLRPPTTADVASSLRYQPSAAIERWIRCRDITCRFPGCGRAAWRADVDHTTPFDHRNPEGGGRTVPTNLACYCRQHHRLKTFHGGPDGWRDEQRPDGTIVWTSPTGRVYRSTPDGADLFDDIADACGMPKPRWRNRRRERATRTAAARRAMAAKRAANDETRRLNRARRDEIDIRKWRNDMRRKLLVFKGGAPSVSPWCTWANDPREDEHITAEWRPPPPPPTTPAGDEPPF
ncbi:hypothetical protein MARA_49210 [Mycolicibacterium arabiense]|uniref:DUF222 domain-containing protein n=1 Tax=Mycolicibacterium arabiense TaxID=1286181 RepID=A0A7I7S447_9MYCO|nr:HNH endonuclease signature motif containing protein [Mycolicibacterium arabiense]MCV7372332.1 DUF222 domain-containing protein [Mycolicibacterium arabiense]BBY51453.1 hypothetical protein MARA_49210 [Mycolicibacterium arabiense]